MAPTWIGQKNAQQETPEWEKGGYLSLLSPAWPQFRGSCFPAATPPPRALMAIAPVLRWALVPPLPCFEFWGREGKKGDRGRQEWREEGKGERREAQDRSNGTVSTKAAALGK